MDTEATYSVTLSASADGEVDSSSPQDSTQSASATMVASRINGFWNTTYLLEAEGMKPNVCPSISAALDDPFKSIAKIICGHCQEHCGRRSPVRSLARQCLACSWQGLPSATGLRSVTRSRRVPRFVGEVVMKARVMKRAGQRCE